MIVYHKVLANKFRPQTFDEVIGQECIMQTLANSFSLGRIHHAYLLSGTRGVGKTTIARLLAKGLNCETGITDKVCRQCVNCCEIEQSRFIDVLEIDAASRTKVEDTREILDNIQYAPARGRFKVYIIDEVHMLSRYSFNALLKTLEEPPAHVKFLLATTDPQKLPITILSRCIQFHLKALTSQQIYQQLIKILDKENIKVEIQAVQLLADSASGSMRDALTTTEQAIAIGHGKITLDTVRKILGVLNTNQALTLLEALSNSNGKAIIEQLSLYEEYGINWENILIEIMFLLHRIAMKQFILDEFNDYKDDKVILRLEKLAKDLAPSAIQLYYQILLIGRKELPYAPSFRMGVEMTLLRALAFYPPES